MASQELIPSDVGLLALIRAVSLDTSIRDRFRKVETFPDVMKEFQIPDAHQELIRATALIGGDFTKPRTAPDGEAYMLLLKALYDSQLSQPEHFDFMW